MNAWFYLGVAIVSEVAATSALKASEGFTRLWPSLLVVAGYAAAFYFLSLTLKSIPVAVAYAVWSGVGIALIALIGTSVGFSVNGGAEGVGRATTRAVVLSISALVLADMLFSFFLNR